MFRWFVIAYVFHVCIKEGTTHYYEKCGIAKQLSNRIIGGENARLGEFPWMAKLFTQRKIHFYKGFGKDYTKITPSCGGVLISKKYVLSAAHCEKYSNIPVSLVRLGEYNTETEIDCISQLCAPAHQDISVERIIKHENYENGYSAPAHDIMLLRLSKEADLNDFVIPICIPSYDEVKESDYFQAAGWGRTVSSKDFTGKNLPQVLQVVGLKNRNMEFCEHAYNLYAHVAQLNAERQLCVGGTRGKDTCVGDSGGPLMTVKEDDDGLIRTYIVGITSFGNAKCGAKAPSIYTKVATYFDWIDRNIED